MASARKSSSWCAPRARCTPSPTAHARAARRSSTTSIATIRNTTPRRSISSCCARSAASVELRVIVDIIAGASAGGINGTMLARALSHDLPMDALRDLWLDNADVTVLLAPEARAGAWSKWFLQAVHLGGGDDRHAAGSIRDLEVRQKLSLFVRSRWFKPPLDGPIMAGLMYDAVTVDGARRRRPTPRCCRPGHSLDLFVTLTDYHGYQQLVQIHDPPLIHELDHHHVLHFTYRRRAERRGRERFRSRQCAGARLRGARDLVVSGRVSAGADRRDGRGGRAAAATPGRGASEFIAKNFRAPPAAPASIRRRRRFIDGAVLNNRPFQRGDLGDPRPAGLPPGRPAAGLYRPAPGAAGDAVAAARCRASSRPCAARMSDIPSSQPVTDELGWVVDFNEQVRRLARDHRQRPPAHQRAGRQASSPTASTAPIAADELRALARAGERRRSRATPALPTRPMCGSSSPRCAPSCAQSDRQAARRAGAIAAVARGRRDHRRLGGAQGHRLRARRQRGARVRDADGARSLPRWVGIPAGLRRQVPRAAAAFPDRGAEPALRACSSRSASPASTRGVVDRLKREFYGRLDALRRRDRCRSSSARRRASWSRTIFPAAPSAGEMPSICRTMPQSFVERHRGKLDRLIERLAAEIDLDATHPRPRRAAGGARSGAVASARRGARCWSTISAFRSGTC